MRKDNGFFNGTPTYMGVSILLFIILIISVLTAVTIGSVDISIKEVYEIILYKLFNIGNSKVLSNGAVHDIVWYVRLPRISLAVAVGMGLAVCGVVMQAIIKNPLADPYILGISSGASLGATLAIMLGIGIYFGEHYVGYENKSIVF